MLEVRREKGLETVKWKSAEEVFDWWTTKTGKEENEGQLWLGEEDIHDQ